MKEPDKSKEEDRGLAQNHKTLTSTPPGTTQANSISNSALTPTTNYAVQEPDPMSLDGIDDNASDVSLEPLDGPDDFFTRPTSKSNSKSNSASKKKTINTPVISNPLYMVLKDMAAGKPAPPVRSADASLLTFSTSLLASIPISPSAPAPPTANNKNDVDVSLVTHGSNLLSSIPVGSATNEPVQDEIKPNPIRKNNVTLPARLQKLVTSLPTPPAKPLPPSATDLISVFKKDTAHFLALYAGFCNALANSAKKSHEKRGLKSQAPSARNIIKRLVSHKSKSPGKTLKRGDSWKGKEKENSEELADELDGMDEQALLDYAIEQSIVDEAIEESLFDATVENLGIIGGEDMIDSISNPSVRGDSDESLVNGGLISTSPSAPTDFPRINPLIQARQGKSSSFTGGQTAFTASRSMNATNATSNASAQDREAGNNANTLKHKEGLLKHKEGTSTNNMVADKMDIDASTPTMGQNSSAGGKESTEAATGQPNALLLQKHAQYTLALMLEDKLSAAIMDTIASASPLNSAQPSKDLTLAPPVSTVLTPRTSTSLLTVDLNYPRPPFKFEKLPSTVRDSIYKLLVISLSPYATTSPRNRRQRRLDPHIPSACTTLFVVNKQISTEARAVFYSHNIFTIGNGRYGATSETNIHGLTEFASIVPKKFRKMVKFVEMEIRVVKGWLGEYREGKDRDFEEVKLQENLVGLGELLRSKFGGIEWVAVRVAKNDVWWGNEVRLGRKARMAVSREEKLDALCGLIDLPYLEYLKISDKGPLSVKYELANISKQIIHRNKVAGRVEYEEGEKPEVVEKEEGEVSEEGEEGEIREDKSQEGKMQEEKMHEGEDKLSVDMVKYGENKGQGEESGNDLLDGVWENPYTAENGDDGSEFFDNDGNEDMVDARSDGGGVLSIFGIDD